MDVLKGYKKGCRYVKRRTIRDLSAQYDVLCALVDKSYGKDPEEFRQLVWEARHGMQAEIDRRYDRKFAKVGL